METYAEVKKRHQEEFNAFPKAVAFNGRQVAEALSRLGVDSAAELCFIGCGVYIRRADRRRFDDMIEDHDAELKGLMGDPDFAYGAFLREMRNHEYHINWDGDFDVVRHFVDRYDSGLGPLMNLQAAGYPEETIRAYIEARRTILGE